MRWNRVLALAVLGVMAACAAEGIDALPGDGPGGSDAGAIKDSGSPKKDGSSPTDAAGEASLPDQDGDVPFDAGPKKDAGPKDSSAADTSTPADSGPTDGGGTDTSVPVEAGFIDAGPPTGILVINEIDYDQPGTDGPEFVEVLNVSASTVNLADYELVFYNGGVTPATKYMTVALGSGTLGAGEYLLAKAAQSDAGATVTVALTGAIQNGPRDVVGIRDVNQDVLIDVLCYGPSGTPPTATGVTLVEGVMSSAIDSNTEVGSLIRNPDGTDTNNNNADFKFTKTITPGSANVYTP